MLREAEQRGEMWGNIVCYVMHCWPAARETLHMMMLSVLCSMRYLSAALGQFCAGEIHRFGLRFEAILFVLMCTDVAKLCVLLPLLYKEKERQ